MKINFPFAAIVGQDELMLAISLNIINPSLGGLLIKGVKGSGKSTAVYAMQDVIPEIEIVEDCKFNCDPQNEEFLCEECQAKKKKSDFKIIDKKVDIVTVPLSVTEDRLLGSVNIDELLNKGKQRFVPGLLTKAHRQVLYIDEVNLLSDHIVDDILDVAALGWNKIERDGFSITHRSNFLLIGTMNPEEGELRPQILDRFPLSVTVKSVTDKLLRKEIITRNLEFQKNRKQFQDLFSQETEDLRNQIKMARACLEDVKVNTNYLDLIVDLCSANNIDGHRADISIIKTAKTHAALELKNYVELRHLIQAAKFVLQHRTREGGISKPLSNDEIEQFFAGVNINPSENSKIEKDEEIDKKINFYSGSRLIQPEKK